MSIEGLVNTPACTESRRAAARQAAPAGSSFQSQLEKTAAGASAGAAPASGGAAAGSGELPRGSLLDTLNDARLLLLRRTKEGREWKKEQEEWDRLMKCLDSWIDALRERAERRREGRGDNVAAEGGDALIALYRGLIAGAVQAEAAGTDPKAAKEDLLTALTGAQATLLERLKEDKAMEEERQEWEDLMRRLDDWIEELRGEGEEPERVSGTEGISAVGPQTGEYET